MQTLISFIWFLFYLGSISKILGTLYTIFLYGNIFIQVSNYILSGTIVSNAWAARQVT